MSVLLEACGQPTASQHRHTAETQISPCFIIKVLSAPLTPGAEHPRRITKDMNLNLILKRPTRLSLCALWFVFASINLCAQQVDTGAPCRPMRRESTYNIPPGEQDIPYCSPKEPANCEVANIYTDMAAHLAQTADNTYLIVVARLGSGEKSRRLNTSRLKHVRDFLGNNRGVTKIVTAEGERTKGYGRLEFYVAGKLLFTLPVQRNKNIDLGSCNAV